MKFDKLFRWTKKDRQPTVAATLADGTVLHEVLRPYQSLIENSALPFVRITATPSDTLTPTQSKFAGEPYWPAGRPFPVDENGRPLTLLAQLNFSEVPPLAGYPERGLLQFFIADDDVYGINFDAPTEQTNFRVVYHEAYDELAPAQQGGSSNNSGDSYLPVAEPMALHFTAGMDYVGVNDVRFDCRFGNALTELAGAQGAQDNEVQNSLWETFPGDGHKIGGYATFTQDDPRGYQAAYKDWILLLQIDSQDSDIMWGDMGVANFFISADDLKRRDFSNVLYNWDCS